MRAIVLLGPRGLRLEVDVPVSTRERARGLRGRGELTGERAMLFRRCRSVHTFGMHASIAVAGLDRRFAVRWVRIVPPGRVVLPRPTTRHILELAPTRHLLPGDRLRVGSARPERHRGELPAALRPSRRRRGAGAPPGRSPPGR